MRATKRICALQPGGPVMRGERVCSVLALIVLALAAVPAAATTLVRQSLGSLVAGNAVIVVGEVVEASSYWNAEGNFILTDVRVKALDVLKGNPAGREITFTIMGGTVGDLTSLIVGGPELVPGSSYVLFLNRANLPGAANVESVPYLSQGVFDIEMAGDGLRAISQANREPMVPDAEGIALAPGGREGVPLGTLMNSVRELAARPGSNRREVKR